MSGREVVVTGIGIVTALGIGAADNWAAMREGRSGARMLTRFPVEGQRTQFAAAVPLAGTEGQRPGDLAEHYGALAIEEALAESGLGGSAFPGPLVIGLPPIFLDWPDRLALAAGAEMPAGGDTALLAVAGQPGFRPLYGRIRSHHVAARLADRFAIRDMPVVLSTACSSGATAIQTAAEAITRGDCEAAIAGGADASLSPEMLTRFSLLAALSRRNDSPETASRPFDVDRDGFVPGEGAGALVLESRAAAEARGARILGRIAGWGETTDGHHRTRSDPSGMPAATAMRAAIARAGLAPDDIDYVNAHGTSTPENDKMEALSCGLVFGERMPRLPVSSTKSMIGHTLSAAGAIEAVAVLMMLREQVILPTINIETQDPEIALDPVAEGARPARLRHVLSNSFGFGGQNACLVLSAGPGNRAGG
ncbi:beta-ketoacyl-ACP synthase [Paralimibaculum aggregatum]|uniref:Beta-ketoacyl-ACP synthase n=1 Tax=Paralimibaculum aggregatum TaxID=3036245 RepID=A0ABQ6LNK2_9RHOB|nr:beta-ketoacyl synthase N-terminal-like domain-containing protein [Limibaculum sp. NKW23]GMG83287.1 beta-ketoacyl-ACP synthase [Limibaculum sp. NKW23]